MASQSRLRVLRLCSVFEPPASALDARGARFDPIGGIQEHTGSLIPVLDERGVVQVVLTARRPTAPWVEHLTPRATVVRVGLPIRKPRQLYALPAGVLAPLLGRHADVVHAHLGEDLAILPLAALAARPRRLPLVLTVHCSPSHTLWIRDGRTALVHTIGGWLERRAVQRAAATVVFTDRLRTWLSEELGCRTVQRMQRGIDRAAFAQPGPDPFPELPARPRVVFLGRLVRAKGLEPLVEAVARLRTPGAQVVVVGDGPDRGRLEKAAARLGLGDRLRVTGFVPHDRVPAVLASADLLVMPSLYEELGAVLIEAMQAGLPVVASRVGGIPELVEDGVTGLLVEPDHPAALAHAIDTVLGDPELAARMGANAKRRGPSYDVARMGAQLHGLYLRLVAERAARDAAERDDLAVVEPRVTLADRLATSLWPA